MTTMIKISEAVQTLQKALKKDKELYEAYFSSLVMSMVDAHRQETGKNLDVKTKMIINKGAQRFLELFMR